MAVALVVACGRPQSRLPLFGATPLAATKCRQPAPAPVIPAAAQLGALAGTVLDQNCKPFEAILDLAPGGYRVTFFGSEEPFEHAVVIRPAAVEQLDLAIRRAPAECGDSETICVEPERSVGPPWVR